MMGTIVRDTNIIIQTVRKMGWNVDLVGQFAVVRHRGRHPCRRCDRGLFLHDAGALCVSGRSAAGGAGLRQGATRRAMAATRTSMARSATPPRNLVLTALDKAGKDLTVDSFIKAMESIHDYTDIFGSQLSFGPDQHHGSTRSFLTVVHGGTLGPGGAAGSRLLTRWRAAGMSAARKRPYFRLHTGYVALAEAHSTSVRPSGPSASLSRPRRCPARSLSARIR